MFDNKSSVVGFSCHESTKEKVRLNLADQSSGMLFERGQTQGFLTGQKEKMILTSVDCEDSDDADMTGSSKPVINCSPFVNLSSANTHHPFMNFH